MSGIRDPIPGTLMVGPETRDPGPNSWVGHGAQDREPQRWEPRPKTQDLYYTNISCRTWDSRPTIQMNLINCYKLSQKKDLSNKFFDLESCYKTTVAYVANKSFLCCNEFDLYIHKLLDSLGTPIQLLRNFLHPFALCILTSNQFFAFRRLVSM